MEYLINKISYGKKWRYELPYYLPISMGNGLTMREKSSWNSESKLVPMKHSTWFKSWKRVCGVRAPLYNGISLGYIATGWWNMNYESSVKERFRRKKTKSGKINKRVNSVLKI